MRIGENERRARLGTRHLLAPAARAEADHAADPAGHAAGHEADPADPAGHTGPTAVANAIVALHATDPATVYLAAAARSDDPMPKSVDDALYERRDLVRILGMRRTMFVVSAGTVPVVEAACTQVVARRERAKLLKWLEHDAAWLAEVEEETLAALRRRGEATTTELVEDVPRLGERVVIIPGRNEPTVSSRVLFLLGADGRAVRTRPVGSWRSGRFRWSPRELWLPEPTVEPAPRAARAELTRRYLKAFGPATSGDLKWWADWKVSDTRQALADVEAVEVDLDEGTGYVLPDDLEPTPPPEPWAALLPGLDPTPMGWFARDWYLGGHKDALFDRTGNVGPTVWWNGRIVGGWTQREDASVVYRLLEDVGADAVKAVDAEVDRLQGWLTETVVPRFRTPLEREMGG